jgi:hypothetical protein
MVVVVSVIVSSLVFMVALPAKQAKQAAPTERQNLDRHRF